MLKTQKSTTKYSFVKIVVLKLTIVIQDRNGPIINLDASARSASLIFLFHQRFLLLENFYVLILFLFFFQKKGGPWPPAPPPARGPEKLDRCAVILRKRIAFELMQLHLIAVLISLKTCVKDYEDNFSRLL